MNSDYVAVPVTATVEEALGQIREHEDLLDTLTTVYMVDAQGRLAGGIPLARLLLADRMNPIGPLGADQATASVTVTERQDRIIEQFDKYNLLALPVVDARGVLAGVITADDIISVLREH
jgi:Mg/Co/Ni transporter MgtE